MQTEWYYTANGGQQGPVSQDQLQQWRQGGQLEAGVLVWRKGMADWQAIDQVPELNAGEQAALATSPAAPVSGLPTQAPSQMAAYPVPIPAQGQDQTLGIVSLICAVLGVVVMCCSPCISIPFMIAAIITGHISLSKIKGDPNSHGGRAFALAGLIISYAWLVLVVVMVCLVFVFNLASLDENTDLQSFFESLENYEDGSDTEMDPETEIEVEIETETEDAAEDAFPEKTEAADPLSTDDE